MEGSAEKGEPTVAIQKFLTTAPVLLFCDPGWERCTMYVKRAAAGLHSRSFTVCSLCSRVAPQVQGTRASYRSDCDCHAVGVYVADSISSGSGKAVHILYRLLTVHGPTRVDAKDERLLEPC